MKELWTSLRMILVLTLLLGLGYPLAVTVFSQALFYEKANGGILTHENRAVGAALIAQKFEGLGYFWPRPSVIDFNPLPSGGSNQGQASAALKLQFEERRGRLQKTSAEVAPQDLLFASGSGLDPHVSVAAARYQVARVAQSRGLSLDALNALVDKHSEPRQLGFLGEPRVNVLLLNLALDKISKEPVSE